jgi:hypothetical protein
MKVECGNCGKVWDEEDMKRVFPDIPDLAERIAPGEPVPAGECPECGALVHGMRETFRCRVCGQVVKTADIREHLIEHNPNAEGMDWEDVRNQFELLTTPDGEQKRVVISVRGGVAEVAYCPRGTTVEIRDYDSDGGDEDELEEDGAWVGTFEGEDD